MIILNENYNKKYAELLSYFRIEISKNGNKLISPTTKIKENIYYSGNSIKNTPILLTD